ncbi:hypothetical protein DNTS_027475 [Danionella cerebrum]|uniref:TLC domain-containing protein n=1 Tax=Danionella cerebrum TaxID=2873325 RepID=A0A553RMB4_9TELE|nr:hypothetical protein DNTS_027475 [Danionella translucida]
MDRLEEFVNRWLWWEDFWLPPGVTWKDISKRTSDEGRQPVPRDLLLTVPLALGFIALRFVFERVVAPPLSRCMGVRDRVRLLVAPEPNLEAFYQRKKAQPSQTELLSLQTLCGLSQTQIRSWLRLRRAQDRPTLTRKFSEAAWRFVFYLLAFSAGLCSLVRTRWFWDLQECWRGYPAQAVTGAQYWYYVLELSFYLSLLLSVSVDIKRKDFKEQIVHHIATIFLIAFSYCANYVRVGTLVMLVHDSSDFLLEKLSSSLSLYREMFTASGRAAAHSYPSAANHISHARGSSGVSSSAKMFNYGGWRKTCDALFVLFAAVFLVTRLVVFPSRIVYTAVVDSLAVFPPYAGYYFLNGLLLVLQALHVFWAYLILRMVHKFIFSGKVERDERSDDESEEEETEEESGWELKKDALNSKLASLANNCVLNNLTQRRQTMKSRTQKTR